MREAHSDKVIKFQAKLDNRFSDGKFVEDVAIEVDISGFFGARS